MPVPPTLVFIPGAWHKPSCYDKVIKPLEDKYSLKCIRVTLPSTQDNPNATFKDDFDVARAAIKSETTQGRDVIVIAHSYGGMVGNSAIKGLTQPKPSHTSSDTTSPTPTPTPTPTQSSSTISSQDQGSSTQQGHVTALILIASGFTFTGFAFMDPFLGHPPPSWRMDKETGYATLVADPRDFFYHDLDDDEAAFWVRELKTQSLKSLYEGGEYSYAGWLDVPVWYLGTVEDRGLPVVVQRAQVAAARAVGATVKHVEFMSSHSPFLSMSDKVVGVLVGVARTVSKVEMQERVERAEEVERKKQKKSKSVEFPAVRLGAPGTLFRFGIPYFFGRVLGWGFIGFMGLRRLWTRRR